MASQSTSGKPSPQADDEVARSSAAQMRGTSWRSPSRCTPSSIWCWRRSAATFRLPDIHALAGKHEMHVWSALTQCSNCRQKGLVVLLRMKPCDETNQQ